ncbi:MAG TPA: hypothetical protein EYQ14_29600 [Gammaproteobacteria bacterium]|nr:hypothetical protein [Gammaproteobacteria bacterium]HIL98632.1 hypothetical protein [Pseudomonadales bacterium]
MMNILVFIYGILSYTIGLGGLVLFILYVGSWDFLPMHINSGTPGPLVSAVIINLGLMLLFGVQHSVMARPGFKEMWTKIIPAAAERSTYVLVTGIIMVLICRYWQPMEGYLWQTENEIAQMILTGGYILGWVIAVIATFLINHFELFGLQQVYLNLVKKPEPSPDFTDRFLYKVVRHPLQLGVLIGIWVTPAMSMTHLMLATTMTIYIFVGLYYEEKDLVNSLGQNYEDYQGRVRMILPLPK